MNPLSCMILCASLLLSGLSVRAEESESVLPSAFPLARYSSEWKNSPFLREVVAPVTQTFESDFAKSIILEGVVQDDQRGTIAYARDTSNKEPLVITSDSQPYKIVSAKQSNDPKETSVTITDGKESGSITYITERLTQAIVQPQPAQPTQAITDPRGKQQHSPKGPTAHPPRGTPPVQPTMPPDPTSPQVEGQNELSTSTETEITTDSSRALPALDKTSEPRRRRIPLPNN